MAVWRFLAYDARSNTALADLPLSVRKFGAVLNGAGSFSGQIPVETSTAALLRAATVPERTIVYIERDGVLLDGFLIWTRARKPGQPMDIAGMSIESILRRNRIVANLTYTGVDQLTIARNLITHMQSQAGADLGIQVGSGLSGVLRDRTYNGYERKNLGDALAELAAVDNGFDWSIDVAWSGGVPVKSLNLSYPRRGRIAGSTGIVFVTGKNILDYEFVEDGTRSARAVDVLGSGDGNDMKIGSKGDTALIDAGYPLTAEVIARKDVSVQTTLDDLAIAAVKARAATPSFLTLTVAPDDIDAGLGTWIVGDDALVQITDDNFPIQSDGTPGYQAYHRIIAFAVDIHDAGPGVVKINHGTNI